MTSGWSEHALLAALEAAGSPRGCRGQRLPCIHTVHPPAFPRPVNSTPTWNLADNHGPAHQPGISEQQTRPAEGLGDGRWAAYKEEEDDAEAAGGYYRCVKETEILVEQQPPAGGGLSL